MKASTPPEVLNDLNANEYGFVSSPDIPKIKDIRNKYVAAAEACGRKRQFKLRIRLK